jgi:hypothetical protein
MPSPGLARLHVMASGHSHSHVHYEISARENGAVAERRVEDLQRHGPRRPKGETKRADSACDDGCSHFDDRCSHFAATRGVCLRISEQKAPIPGIL